MVKEGRKAQVGIITIVLIILIVIILIAIIWNIIVPLVREKAEGIQFGQFTVNLEVQEVVLFENGVSMISVNRKSGNEKLDGLKFVFYDDEGNSAVRDKEGINELETKTYSFSAIPEIGKISKVGVAPIINGKLGMVIESKPEGVLEIPSGVISWWRFDDLNDFIGGNTCITIEGGINNGILNGTINCSANGLNFSDNMAISFWIKNNIDGSLIKKGSSYEISLKNNQINFSYNGGSVQTLIPEGVVPGWDHIVVSVDVKGVSKIYINKNLGFSFEGASLSEDDSSLIIDSLNGEVDEVMIFDKPITNIEGIYNIQKKE